MDVIAVIGAINGLTQLTTSLLPLAQQAMALANSGNAAELQAAIDKWAATNDLMFPLVQQQLRDAGQVG